MRPPECLNSAIVPASEMHIELQSPAPPFIARTRMMKTPSMAPERQIDDLLQWTYCPPLAKAMA